MAWEKLKSPCVFVLEELMSDFQLWLDQPVWMGQEKILRRDYIPSFAESVTFMMKNYGYKMCPEWRSGSRILAAWMYRIMCDELRDRKYDAPLPYPQPYHRNWPEDLNEFHYIIDNALLNSFFQEWISCDDFDPNTRVGSRIRYELHQLLYVYIDMDASRNGIRIAEMLEDSDSDSDSWHSGGGRREDVYLEEAREGFHGGRGAKV
jgi:hypothetical protein